MNSHGWKLHILSRVQATLPARSDKPASLHLGDEAAKRAPRHGSSSMLCSALLGLETGTTLRLIGRELGLPTENSFPGNASYFLRVPVLVNRLG